MARQRRTYTPEFKAEAVKLVTEQGYSVAEAALAAGRWALLDVFLTGVPEGKWQG
jgi:transposase-like protein